METLLKIRTKFYREDLKYQRRTISKLMEAEDLAGNLKICKVCTGKYLINPDDCGHNMCKTCIRNFRKNGK